MKIKFMAAAALAMTTAGSAFAHDSYGAQAHSHPQHRAHSHSGAVVNREIRINCFRGPWNETIWDHPRAVFIDDLMMFGYDYADASAIAYRICRDVTTVNNPEGMKAALLNAIAQTPPPVGH